MSAAESPRDLALDALDSVSKSVSGSPSSARCGRSCASQKNHQQVTFPRGYPYKPFQMPLLQDAIDTDRLCPIQTHLAVYNPPITAAGEDVLCLPKTAMCTILTDHMEPW